MPKVNKVVIKGMIIEYSLPKELIAQEPIKERSRSRLMVFWSRNNKIEHRYFYEILNYLEKGDVLVVNNSRVVKAKLVGRKPTGGKVEALLVRKVDNKTWKVLLKGKKLREGMELYFKDFKAKIIKDDEVYLKFDKELSFDDLEIYGETPLPPYIKNPKIDHERYQTVYAEKPGSIASPTAGLHFTEELLKKIERKGVKIAKITLHVGTATFKPLSKNYKPEPEAYEVSKEAAEIINYGLENSRIFAVGTTVVKTLETVAENGRVVSKSGFSNLFIEPGYNFKLKYGGMITNFHLPRSSNILLVAAFVGSVDKILNAYKVAIEKRYRFYSFGDAMLILK